MLPCMPWRAGAASAAVRSAALSALYAALERRLITPCSILRLASARHGLLARLLPALSDECPAAVRLTGARAIRLVVQAAGPGGGGGGLPEGDSTKALKKLRKRLEDASDEVRIAACAALAALVQVQSEGRGLKLKDPGAEVAAETAALRECLLLHVADGNPAVQAAAHGVLQACK